MHAGLHKDNESTGLVPRLAIFFVPAGKWVLSTAYSISFKYNGMLAHCSFFFNLMLDYIEDYIPHYIQQSAGDKDV